MTANSQLLTATHKTKPRANQANNQNMRVVIKGVGGGERGKGTENKQHKGQVENRQGEGKNRAGNVEAKELIYI